MQVLHLVTLITSVSLDITGRLTKYFNHSHCNRETKIEQLSQYLLVFIKSVNSNFHEELIPVSIYQISE